jgi:amino acid transporter
VTTSAEEVRKPRDIHRGMLIALAVLVVVCSLITVAMSHVLDHHQLVSAYPQLSSAGPPSARPACGSWRWSRRRRR